MNSDIYYKKNKNAGFFKDLEKYGFENTQNYIPIYNRFFKVNENNWNTINLDNKSIIKSIHSRVDGKYEIYKIYNQNNKLTTSFFKVAPLIDPIKYMTGKYKNIDESSLFSLPSFNQESMKNKDDPNNVSYVDAFFYYLSSKLLQEHNFLHGTNYYGCFIAMKNDFKLNVYDDIEYLQESTYFLENSGKLFDVNDDLEEDIINFDTRKNKKKITVLSLSQRENDVNESNDKQIRHSDTLSISSLNELDEFDSVFRIENDNKDNSNINHIDNENSIDLNMDIENVYNNENSETYDTLENIDLNDTLLHKLGKDDNSDTSSCSSRTSCTSTDFDLEKNNILEQESDNDEDEDEDDKNSDDENGNSDSDGISDSSSDSDDEYIEASIKKFPVNIICIENMEHTLDYYMENYDIDDKEWSAILMQIIMTLITYQKCYDFTHNDLHTNNIMFVPTEERFLYYVYNNKYYKVPTYNKIFKIIDFGRAIYKFQGRLICSDNYAQGNDASTQYNFGPYYDETKPLLEPNKSFDLCRLACSLYDYFFDSEEDIKDIQKNSVEEIVYNWTKDDNNKNVLYKSNGKERYPGFKLYKMIARNVHKHIPEDQLQHKLFYSFQIQRKNIKSKTHIHNIDKIPVFC
jgi:hypothetical protein